MCFCGDHFDNLLLLYSHAVELGHRWKCACGHMCGTQHQIRLHKYDAHRQEIFALTTIEALKGLRGDLGVINANIDMTHAHAKSVSRPTCSEKFYDVWEEDDQSQSAEDRELVDTKAALLVARARDALKAHQKEMVHCFCQEHDMAFKWTEVNEDHCSWHDGRTERRLEGYQDQQELRRATPLHLPAAREAPGEDQDKPQHDFQQDRGDMAARLASMKEGRARAQEVAMERAKVTVDGGVSASQLRARTSSGPAKAATGSEQRKRG